MAAKRKSTVKIPVNTRRNIVPHWTEDKDWCERHLAELTSDLEDGFKPSPNTTWTEADWRRWIQSRIDEFTFDWREPWEFVDTFKITGYGRGRSAAYFDLESQTTGLKCVMMMSDISELILNATLVKGEVTGRWTFVKKGANYGIKYLGAE
jgi:hypothetical protein